MTQKKWPPPRSAFQTRLSVVACQPYMRMHGGQRCMVDIVAGELHLFRDSSHLFCVELTLYLSILNPQSVEEQPAFYGCMPDCSELIAVNQTHVFPSRRCNVQLNPQLDLPGDRRHADLPQKDRAELKTGLPCQELPPLS